MSFSSEVREQLVLIPFKKACCRESFGKGKELLPFVPSCANDMGCYLRGVFVKCGFVSRPSRNFMLSFLPGSEEYAAYLSGLLTEAGLPPHISTRRGKPLLYYRDSESIEDVISFIGGVKISLGMISDKVMNDVRNNANRLCNAETANLDRMARAAAEQCEAIRKIIRLGAFGGLPAELRECAELRLANPDMSLEELRKLLREPISRSGLNHRLKRITELAETIGE